nr:MAG TPA: hypothetical protein [Caudoviricetes sp.]
MLVLLCNLNIIFIYSFLYILSLLDISLNTFFNLWFIRLS